MDAGGRGGEEKRGTTKQGVRCVNIASCRVAKVAKRKARECDHHTLTCPYNALHTPPHRPPQHATPCHSHLPPSKVMHFSHSPSQRSAHSLHNIPHNKAPLKCPAQQGVLKYPAQSSTAAQQHLEVLHRCFRTPSSHLPGAELGQYAVQSEHDTMHPSMTSSLRPLHSY